MFLKKILSGKDFADGLVLKVSSDVYDNWDTIQGWLAEALGQDEAQYDKYSEG